MVGARLHFLWRIWPILTASEVTLQDFWILLVRAGYVTPGLAVGAAQTYKLHRDLLAFLTQFVLFPLLKGFGLSSDTSAAAVFELAVKVS